MHHVCSREQNINKVTTFYVATSVSTLATNPTNADGKPSLNRTLPSADSRLNQEEAMHACSRPNVYVATEQEAFDLVEKQDLMLGSICWSHWLDEFEARVGVYQSEDDKNYGDVLHNRGHLVRPVEDKEALFAARLNACDLVIAMHEKPDVRPEQYRSHFIRRLNTSCVRQSPKRRESAND